MPETLKKTGLIKKTVLSGFLLALFALIGTGLVATTHELTHKRIADNEKAALLRSLNSLIKTSEYDNDLFNDTIEISGKPFLGTNKPVVIYRARKKGVPVAVLFTVIAPDGYGGPIKLLVGIYENGTMIGARVLSHSETPGLGDAIDEKRSPWIFGFSGRSLSNPTRQGWQVKKDGGIFDQFTGATITPRAVVKAVHHAVQFFAKEKTLLFSQPENDAKFQNKK